MESSGSKKGILLHTFVHDLCRYDFWRSTSISSFCTVDEILSTQRTKQRVNCYQMLVPRCFELRCNVERAMLKQYFTSEHCSDKRQSGYQLNETVGRISTGGRLSSYNSP